MFPTIQTFDKNVSVPRRGQPKAAGNEYGQRYPHWVMFQSPEGGSLRLQVPTLPSTQGPLGFQSPEGGSLRLQA